MASHKNLRQQQHLEERILKLEEENKRLHGEIKFLRNNPTIAKGMKGESLVAKWLKSRPARKGAGHDLESSKNNLRFEVKYSSLLDGIVGRPLKRWVWTKLFGELGRKSYDRLLLVGDADPRFLAHYADPSSPYVLFDLPYSVVVEMAGGVKPGRYGLIHLTTNPLSVRSPRSIALFRQFQVSVPELQYRYGNLEVLGENNT